MELAVKAMQNPEVKKAGVGLFSFFKTKALNEFSKPKFEKGGFVGDRV